MAGQKNGLSLIKHSDAISLIFLDIAQYGTSMEHNWLVSCVVSLFLVGIW